MAKVLNTGTVVVEALVKRKSRSAAPFPRTLTHVVTPSKPKFFQAHKIDGGLIEQLTILNPPVQVFSINGCTNTKFAYITIDGAAGDSKAKNTDAFDIGSSSDITIGMRLILVHFTAFTDTRSWRDCLQPR
jgi:polygalacturonase